MRMEAELDIADVLDLDRAVSPTTPPPRPHSARPSRCTCAGRKRSATSPVPRPRSTSTPRAPPAPRDAAPARRPRGRAPRPLRRVLDGLTTVFGPTGRMEEGQRLVLLDQVTRLVCRLPDEGHDQAGHRPQHRPVHPGLRDPRPDPRAGNPPRRHVRVPVVHPPCPGLRHRPRRRVRPRRRSRRPTTTGPTHTRQPRRPVPLPPPPQDPHRLALPPWPSPECSSGPHRTDTVTDATATARPRPDHAEPPDPPGIPRPRRR